jgi:hypothetical protein
MFRRAFRLVPFALTALLSGVGAQTPAEASLAPRFAQAARDDGALADLIVEGSLAIASLDGEAGHALAERLHSHCQRAFFSSLRFDGMQSLGLQLHEVASGELPARIAKRFSVSPGLLSALNADYDERRLAVGVKLKVLDARGLSLVADTRRCRLAAWLERGQGERKRLILVGYWPIGVGAQATPTPIGRSFVSERALDPQWTDPRTGQVHAPGSAENVLGGYWMRLDEAGLGKRGIGLHGYTKAPPQEWLEKRDSDGCLRLRKADIAQVFHLALEGTPITIVE